MCVAFASWMRLTEVDGATSWSSQDDSCVQSKGWILIKFAGHGAPKMNLMF